MNRPRPEVSPSRLQPQVATTSLTRGESGAVGATSHRNMSPSDTPASGMAVAPSSVATREIASQRQSAVESLTSQSASRQPRAVAQADLSQSAMQVNSELTSRIKGQREAAPTSTEAAAARQDSALVSNPTRDYSADIGAELVDTGSEKRVSEVEVVRDSNSGGGQVELGTMSQEHDARNRRNESASAPSLATNEFSREASSPETNGVAAPSDRPTSIEQTASTESSRSSQPARLDSRELSTSLEEALSNSGDATTGQVSRAEHDDEDDEDSQLAVAQGAETTRNSPDVTSLSRSPVRRSDITAGSENNENGMVNSGLSEPRLAQATGAGSGRAVTQRSANRTSDSSAIASVTESSGKIAASRETDLKNGKTMLAKNESENVERRRDSEASLGVASLPTPQAANESAVAMGESRKPTEAESQVQSDRLGGSQRVASRSIEGPSGFGENPEIDAGQLERPASRESKTLQATTPDRFQRSSASDTPQSRADAVVANEAFRQRAPTPGSGGPTTEPSIELGLQFLSRFQKADGRWALEDFDVDRKLHKHQLKSDSAATGLALLAFQGAGYHHREYKYAGALSQAIDWLVQHQDEDGGLYVSTDSESDRSCRMYSHAIATLALTEAYGMTHDPELREPCQRAIDYIVKTQDPKRGGWRYYAEMSARQTDTSVTGWMMMALQSGRLSGFRVPATTWERIDDWMEGARMPEDNGQYRYRPQASGDLEFQKNPTHSISAVGILMKLYTGWNRNDPRVDLGADHLLENMPSLDKVEDRDTYYWYYATQVLRHVGGAKWRSWNTVLHPLLLESQIKTGEFAGSWDPYSPVPDRWGHIGGRLYVTTMNLLSLEVDYRLLPLYEETTR
ncbi:MAG: prenyltransferase/squalene oxidase repeat-containing protein [Pirellulaceae bacterium]